MHRLARLLLFPILITAGILHAEEPAGPAPVPNDGGPRYWWVTVAGEPTATTWRKEVDRGNESRAGIVSSAGAKKIAATRAQVRAEIERKLPGKAQVIYEVGKLLNGMAVRCDDALPQKLKNVAGVVSVVPLQVELPNLSTSVPFVNAPEVWEAASIQGDGVRIGIIDTGVDYLHTDFGGPGTGYAENDTTITGDSAFFPGARVVGGTDLAGDSYDANSSTPSIYTPDPDPDPMDCGGHGSHVAGIAAGSGVNNNGTTFAGPYDTAVPFSTLRIGPGVAPKADIYAIRVFGCTGSTNLVVEGMDWASDPNDDEDFSDHLDVVNISIGSDYTAGDGPDGMAADALSALGTIVVCSAGNSGDTICINGGPSVAKSSVAVASSMDDGVVMGEVAVSPTGAIFDAGMGELSTPDTTGVTANISIVSETQQTACFGVSSVVNGKIAVIRAGGCSANTKIKAAQNAGAVGVIITRTAGVIAEPARISDVTITIPYVVISKADGVTLASQYANNSSIQVTLRSKAGTPKNFADTMSPFTSRGPAISADGPNLKPDISAPGHSIISVKALSGNLPAFMSGTSMASPHVAGGMTLLREKFPDDTVEELKARLMSNSSDTLTTREGGGGVAIPPQRGGAGRMDLQAAINATAFAMNTDGDNTVSVNFGRMEVETTGSYTRAVKVVNRSAQQRTWNLSYTSAIQQPGVSITLPSSVTVSGNSSSTFNAQVDVNVAQMDKHLDPSMDSYQNAIGGGDYIRDFMIEESGSINFAAVGGGNNMHLPLYIIPQPAAHDLATPSTYQMATNTGSKDIVLAGTAFNMGSNFPNVTPLDVTPVTSIFQWLGSSPQEQTATGSLSCADVKNYGIYYIPAGTLSSTVVNFALSTWQNWDSPGEVVFVVQIDNDGDQDPDYELYNSSVGQYYGDARNDVPIDVAYSYNSNSSTSLYASNRPPGSLDMNRFGSNVMTLSATAGNIGISASAPTFNYRILTFLRSHGDYVEYMDWKSFDLSKTGVSTSALIQTKKAGDTINTTFDKIGLTANGALGVLVFHHHNGFGYRDQTLSFDAPPPPPGAAWMLH